MASTGKKVATGCGIGCLLIVIILGGLGTCTYLGVRNVKDHAEGIDESFEVLDDRFGSPEDFTPPAGGRVAADRMAVFLALRDDLLVKGAQSIETLTTLDGDAGILAKIRAGMHLIGSVLDFVEIRNAALIDHDMSPGEYLYLYTTVYYSWLGKDPGDGPDFRLSGDDEDDGVNVRWSGSDHDEDARADRAREVRRTFNRLALGWFANGLAAIEAGGAIDPEWRRQLSTESEALRTDPVRLAWQDGLPAALETSVAPFREDLESRYDPYLNALEMSLFDDD